MTVEELCALLAQTLAVEPSAIDANTKAADVEAWDSMGTMSILLALTRKLGIRLAPNEAGCLQSVPQIVELLRAKGKLS
jgi:acyl carrier protein